MIHISIDPEKIDYSKPISYYAKEWGYSYSGLKHRLKRMGILKRFVFASGENTGKLRGQMLRSQYAQSPKHCKRCDGVIPYEQRGNKYCCASCSKRHYDETHPEQLRARGQEASKRIQEGTWKKPIPPLRVKSPKTKKLCEHCQKPFFVYPSETHRRFCSPTCSYLGFDAKCGGYREGSGRGKRGWYKGFYCASSWELAWVVYHLEHQIAFERNLQSFPYVFEGKTYQYYPDYRMSDGAYVEIKGYTSKKWEAKLAQFPHSIKVLYKSDMRSILDYVTKKYGADYIKLYEKRP